MQRTPVGCTLPNGCNGGPPDRFPHLPPLVFIGPHWATTKVQPTVVPSTGAPYQPFDLEVWGFRVQGSLRGTPNPKPIYFFLGGLGFIEIV